VPQKLDCSDDLRLALLHLDQKQMTLALTLLTKWEGCNESHLTCPYRGEDCAVQDLIEGFFPKGASGD